MCTCIYSELYNSIYSELFTLDNYSLLDNIALYWSDIFQISQAQAPPWLRKPTPDTDWIIFGVLIILDVLVFFGVSVVGVMFEGDFADMCRKISTHVE
jgi:hypothetical protein